MVAIGGFRFDLSIKSKTGNPLVFCFPKSRINENGGTVTLPGCRVSRDRQACFVNWFCSSYWYISAKETDFNRFYIFLNDLRIFDRSKFLLPLLRYSLLVTSLLCLVTPGGDDKFDTKTLTFAITVSNFSPWVINLFFRIVESGSDLKQQILALLVGHHSQLVSHKICSHFAISWGFVYLVKQSRSLPWWQNQPSIQLKRNNRSYHWLQCTGSQ